MKMAAAIVTNRGGRTCHAAIVARELGIPAVVGAERRDRSARGPAQRSRCPAPKATPAASTTARCRSRSRRIDLGRRSSGRGPQIMINLGNPELGVPAGVAARTTASGLARMEFIINEHIGVHPMALLASGAGRRRRRRERAIARADRGLCRDRPITSSSKLAEGVGTIAAAFYPKPVIVRLSDFKTNEYAGLLGGARFEPKEENPMLGFRGASRYAHPAYARGFALECAAMQRVREEMGLTNVKLMVPFCRRVDGGRAACSRRWRSTGSSAARTGSRSTSCARSRTTSS